MIPRECKRLAEVDFPIAVVSKHSVQEKSIRRGHPSTIHLWWARRPLAACRAMLLTLLLPDTCDRACPPEFKADARRILLEMRARPSGWNRLVQSDEGLRKVLLAFVGDFASWDNLADQEYLDAARALVNAAFPEEAPLVVDPFAGGGSIPLEALRIGCEAFASDLNPVAALILKMLLEDIPRGDGKLLTEVSQEAERLERAIQQELGVYYLPDSDDSVPFAYLWARTVRCEAPRCGAEVPLVSSFWLCKSARNKVALRCRVAHSSRNPPDIRFELFEPQSDREVPQPTVSLARVTCPACQAVLEPERVRAQLSQEQGGCCTRFDQNGHRVGGSRLLAVVTRKEGYSERSYRLPEDRDYELVYAASLKVAELSKDNRPGSTSVLPNESTPVDGTGSVGGGYRTRKYGVHDFGGFFNDRQKLSLLTIAQMIAGADVSPACRNLLASALSTFVRSCNGNTRLRPNSTVAPAFGMQTLPITWTFPETVPWGGRSEHFDGALHRAMEVVAAPCLRLPKAGQAQIADAAEYPMPAESASVWFTDPPYYDSVPYADLSDFFFVWLKRACPGNTTLRDPFDPGNALTPKTREAVRDQQNHLDGRPKKSTEWYRQVMGKSFSEGRRVLREDGIGSVVFAHKSTDGWESLLSAIILGGWTVTASWPIATEAPNRLRARESAALATSVHLVCRPRPAEAPTGDWSDVLRELPKRVGDWMEHLQTEGIRGADLVFACIGPALEVFSRYRNVETTEGHTVELPEYLEKVWEVVGRTALEHVLGTAEAKARNGAAGALEEDARLTALFLWTLQATEGMSAGGEGTKRADDESSADDEDEGDEPQQARKKAKGMTLIFDVARRFAQPLGIHLDEWEGRIVETEKGVVRLLPVKERSKQLFGEEGAQAMADRVESSAGPIQLSMFAEEGAVPSIRARGRTEGGGKESADEQLRSRRGATTLDRVHAAMLLQASGRANALRALIRSEQERGPDFIRLANALHALYPKDSEERRLLGAMLLAVPR